MTPSARRALVSVAAVAAAWSSSAQAADDLESARTVYDMARTAHEAGDYVTAAALFARADELEPSDVALEAALRAAVRADAPVLALDLVDRGEERVGEAAPGLREAVDVARRRFADRVGTLRIECAGCDVTVDDEPARAGVHRVAVGHHLVVLSRDDDAEKALVRVDANEVEIVRPTWAPAAQITPKAPAAPPPEEGGIGRGWFWVSSGVTAAMSIATVVSAIDTVRRHQAFRDEPSPDRGEMGQDAQTRTQILLGATGGALLVTAAIGLFGVEWSPTARPVTGSLDVQPGGASARLQLAF